MDTKKAIHHSTKKHEITVAKSLSRLMQFLYAEKDIC